MALSDDKLWDLWNAQGTDNMSKEEAFVFARAIEAEVRKDDEALIRQMESALSWSSPHADVAHGWRSENWARKRSEAITAARARLLDSDLSNLTERGAKAWVGVDAQGLRDGSWYMVTHDGVATLCEDRRDAEKEAKDADMAWPHSGPHRAVQLVEASTAGFTAADMAIAEARGFRDGVASLSANAGEPVAWQYRSLRDNGAWFDCTKERFEMRCTQPEIWETRALYAAPPTAQAEGWKDGIEAVAKMLEKKADDFAQQHGYEEMGSLSFGRGPHADAKLDHHSLLCELAEEVRGLTTPTSAEGVEHG